MAHAKLYVMRFYSDSKKKIKKGFPFLISLYLIVINPRRLNKYITRYFYDLQKIGKFKKLARYVLNIVDPESRFLLKIHHRNFVYLKFAQQCDHTMLPAAVSGYNEFTTASARPKLAVICRPSAIHFLRPGLAPLGRNFEIVYFPSFEPRDVEKLKNMDVIFFEWGSTLPILGLLEKDILEKSIVRIHDYEIDSSEYMRPKLLKKCKNFIFINEDLKNRFLRLYGRHVDGSKCHVVPNVISPPLKSKENIQRVEKSILFVMIQYSQRKRLDRCLRIFQRLLQADPEFKLTIHCGFNSNIPDLEALSDEVRARIRISIGDLPNNEKDAWKIGNKLKIQQIYEAHDIVVSTSDREGFHYAIAEGMTNGCYPVVWHWSVGNPRQFWGPWVVDTEEEFAEKVLEFSRLSPSRKAIEREAVQSFVRDSYGLSAFSAKILKVISRFYDTGKLVSKRKPRIAFLAHNHLVRDNPRGGEKSSMMIVRHLVDNGYDVVIVARGKPNTEPEAIYEDGLLHVNIPHLDFTLGAMECLTWIQPDVVLTWELAAKMSYEVCLAQGIPYLVFIRFWHIVQPPPYTNLLEQSLDEAFVDEHRPIFTGADALVSNSKHTREVIKRIYNVDSEVSYVPVRPPLRETTVRSAEAPVLVINPNKTMGFEFILSDILELADDVPFRIIQGQMMTKRKNVEVLPYLEGEYEDLFDNVSVLLFPFSQEPCGTGRVVFEAYNLGIPVIATRISGIPEVVDENCLMERDATAADWHSKIVEILDNYEFYSRRSKDLACKFDVFDELGVILKTVEKLIPSRHCTF